MHVHNQQVPGGMRIIEVIDSVNSPRLQNYINMGRQMAGGVQINLSWCILSVVRLGYTS